MSEPRWTTTQTEAAEHICVAVERSLEFALGGAYISPRLRRETARILAGSDGLVDTVHPVLAVRTLNGETVSPPGEAAMNGEQELLDGFVVAGHRLRRPDLAPNGLSGLSPYGIGDPAALGTATPYYIGNVQLVYLAGWGADPGLTLAIMMKAQPLMANRHSDTVTVRGLSAQNPPKPNTERWTKDELIPLGAYRRLSVGQRT